MKQWWLGYLSLALLSGVACGKQHEDVENGLFVGMSEHLRQYAEAMCGAHERCTDTPSSECIGWFHNTSCGGKYETLELPSLRACVSALDGLSCGESLYALPECAALRSALSEAHGNGSLAREGETCSDWDKRCDVGLYCDGEPDQCGVCKPELAKGATCRANAYGQCAEGLYCNGEGTCVDLQKKGSPCRQFIECAEGLSCLLDHCQERADLVGVACTTALDCDDELSCVAGKCAAPKALGEACAEDPACDSRFCIDGRCAERVTCARGERGDGCFLELDCADGLICVTGTYRCEVPMADGETGCDPFAVSSRCGRASYCAIDAEASEGADEPVSMCVPKLADGATCSGQVGECASGFCTSEGRCGPPGTWICE